VEDGGEKAGDVEQGEGRKRGDMCIEEGGGGREESGRGGWVVGGGGRSRGGGARGV